jgi:hypothetical protein
MITKLKMEASAFYDNDGRRTGNYFKISFKEDGIHKEIYEYDPIRAMQAFLNRVWENRNDMF